MHALKKLFTAARYCVIALSFVSGFFVGAIFGDTVCCRFSAPSALTYFLAQ